MTKDSDIFLYDYSFLPALMEDYGYYLLKQDTTCFYQQQEQLALEPPVDLSSSSPSSLQNIKWTDKKLRFISTVDLVVWEHGKYRVYLHSLRLLRFTSSEESLSLLSSFMARMVLGTITKYGLDQWVHSDYVISGTDRVYRANEKQRRLDVQMVHRLHAIFRGRDYLDRCSSSFFPNLKANYKGIFQLEEEEKKQHQQIGEKVGDVSMVWQCGVKRRQFLRKQKIYSWKDPHFPDYFFPLVSNPNRIQIIENMISLASSSTEQHPLLFPSRKTVLQKFPILQEHVSSWVFVDFETDFQKCIYLMGYYTQQDGYQCLWSDNLDSCSEKDLMHQIYSTLLSLKETGKLLCYYVAENNFWKERCRFHKLPDYIDLFADMLDLYEVFLHGPFLIQNVFSFKLKTIASRLWELGYIPIQQPKGCEDGAQSVEIARQYFKTRDKELGLVLERYNQFDCQVLYELVYFLQNYYQLS